MKGAMKMMHNLKRLVSTSGNGKAESGANEGEEEEEEEALDTAEQESRIK